MDRSAGSGRAHKSKQYQQKHLQQQQQQLTHSHTSQLAHQEQRNQQQRLNSRHNAHTAQSEVASSPISVLNKIPKIHIDGPSIPAVYENHTDTQDVTDTEMSSIGTTQALEEGLSVATSKFNTERFGALSVHPNSTSATHPGVSSGLSTERDIQPSGLQDDDDFDPNNNFDNFDDLDFTELDDDFEDQGNAMETDIVLPQSPPDRRVDAATRPRSMLVEENSLSASQSEALREKLAEMEELLKTKDAELQMKSGEVSILRSNLELRKKEVMKIEDDLRLAHEKHRAEMLAAEEKLKIELEKTEVAHHFAVSKMIMDGQKSTKVHIQQPVSRQPGTPFPAVFISSSPSAPSTQLPFSSSQMPIKTKPKSDDSFSLDVFKPSQNVVVRSRSVGPRTATFEKPKSVAAHPTDPARTTRPVFGFYSDIPSQSPEEIIRDHLLTGKPNDYGLSQLRLVDPDEEGYMPLKGSKRHSDNMQLGLATQQCFKSILDLIQKVTMRSKTQALRDTTRVLQLSLILDKPLHALNSLKVLRILMALYEDLTEEISRGSVPFLEHDNEDAWIVQPSEASLPSTLACINYLLLTRLARNPPTKNAIGGVVYKLNDEAEDIFQLEIIQSMNYISWAQMESMQLARTFVPLIRKGIFEEMIRFRAEKNDLRNLRLLLDILDIATRDIECCKLIMGWRVSQQAWGRSFKFLTTLTGLFGAKTETLVKLALVQSLVYILRDLEELAAEIHHRSALVSIHRDAEKRFTSRLCVNRTHPLLEKPLLMTSTGVNSKFRALKSTGTEKGVSPLASIPLNPYDKVFDYLAVMKLGMEMILNLLRTFPDDMRVYFGRRPNEKHALAFTVSKIESRELGLTEDAQNLAHDILFDLVPDEETEQEYIDLVRD
ncbi:hypothetical protein FBU30_006371 [Linnemannia zychae]|nr:hypothetical protein FBU30_006371 [Linnemannia zychae]